MPGLRGGALSTRPVVAEVVEPRVGLGTSEASRELFEACRSGDLQRVRKLLTAKNVNSRDTSGRKSTPLHYAAGETLFRLFRLFRLFVLCSLILQHTFINTKVLMCDCVFTVSPP